jgi:hypothetical protein
MVKKVKLKKFRDPNNKFVIKKPNNMFSLPHKILLSGNSGAGKTQMLLSLLLSNDGFKNDFQGTDMYIFAPTICNKLEHLIDKKKIPDMNLFIGDLDEQLLSELYDNLIDEYETSMLLDETPTFKVIIFDDIGFSGKMSSIKKTNNIFNKIACNCRKYGICLYFLVQDYYQCNKVVRNQMTGLVLFNMNNRSLDAIESENNFLKNKKDFKEMVRSHLQNKHDHIIINYDRNVNNGLYLNSDFENINPNKNE